MTLENKTIIIYFVEDFYIKEHLLYELKKMMKIKNIKIIPILNFYEVETIRKLSSKDINQIEKITKNKMIYYNNKVVGYELIKSADILILMYCRTKFISKIIDNIFDSPNLYFVKKYKQENKPIIIGINSNNESIFNTKKIENLYSKTNCFFIPVVFSNPILKPNQITFDSSLIIKTTELALDNKQIKPFKSISYI